MRCKRMPAGREGRGAVLLSTSDGDQLESARPLGARSGPIGGDRGARSGRSVMRRSLVPCVALLALLGAWIALRGRDAVERATDPTALSPSIEAMEAPAGRGLDSRTALEVPAPAVESEAREPVEARGSAAESDREPERAFCVRVLERGTREPIAGARVTLVDMPIFEADLHNGAGLVATSDGEGRFRVPAGARGWRVGLRIDARGFGCALLPVLEGDDRIEREVEVLLERSAALQVAVLDAEGDPIPARVTVSVECRELAPGSNTDATLSGELQWSAVTEGQDPARFDELPARVALRVDSGRFTSPPAPLHLAPGETRRFEWRVGYGAALEVAAFEADGSPASGVALVLERAKSERPYFLAESPVYALRAPGERQERTTDARGRARFEHVPAGKWAVGPEPARRTERGSDDPAPLARIVRVPASGEVQLDLRLQRGLAIRGRVVAPDGGELRAGIVSAWEEAQGLSASGISAEGSGSFVVGPLAPGRYRLSALAPPFAPSEPVTVEAGARDVELRLREAAVLEGRVVDVASGRPRRATLVLSSDEADSSYQSTDARSDGRFRFDGLVPATYRLCATAIDGSCGLSPSMRVEEGAAVDGVEIALEPGARLRFVFDGPAASAVVELLHGGAVVGWSPVGRGGAVDFVAPPGRCTLRLIRFDGSLPAERELELSVGEELEIAHGSGWR